MSDLSALGVGAGIALATAILVMLVTALVARAQQRVVVVDTAWGLGFVVIGVAAAAVGSATGHGEDCRSWLAAALTAVWGLRLAHHLHRRNRGSEDPRYEELLGGPLDEVGLPSAVRRVFAPQGIAMACVGWPLAAGALVPVEFRWAVVGGIAVWLVGLVFEAVGDRQLAAYRARPRAERPPVLDTGLWRYTRHPNYFGDACAWWGLWLVAGLGSGWVIGAVTVVAPLAMTWFLVAATGARLLERTLMQRPAYREYAARTSMFLPLPPRSRG